MFSILDASLATLVVVILYASASIAVKHRWGHSAPINPLKITADITGRASLSITQLFFFTLIVVWLAMYWAMHEGKLVSPSYSVLTLLGIAIGGAGVGRATDTSRFRVTGENWAWSKRKSWIQSDFTKASSDRQPRFSDLITSDQGFEIARFQAVAFTLIVGFSLLYGGATAEDSKAFSKFSVGEGYLALIGMSQSVYVGGKLVGANLFAELNAKLDKVRQLELAFTTAVAKSAFWTSAAVEDRTMMLAREQCAPEEYTAYMGAATAAAEIVGSLTGNDVNDTQVQPALPP